MRSPGESLGFSHLHLLDVFLSFRKSEFSLLLCKISSGVSPPLLFLVSLFGSFFSASVDVCFLFSDHVSLGAAQAHSVSIAMLFVPFN